MRAGRVYGDQQSGLVVRCIGAGFGPVVADGRPLLPQRAPVRRTATSASLQGHALSVEEEPARGHERPLRAPNLTFARAAL